MRDKSGFHDPIAPKEKKIGKYPWDFKCPEYDDRNKQKAGINHGVGFRNPVGTMGGPSNKGAVPMGKVATMDVKKFDDEDSL